MVLAPFLTSLIDHSNPMLKRCVLAHLHQMQAKSALALSNPLTVARNCPRRMLFYKFSGQ